MAEFTLDFSQANDGNIADGTYEAVINKVVEDATKGGAEFVNFDLIVRNDIDQAYKNSHIFHRVWRAKATGKYNQGMLVAIAKAADMQNGKKYNSFEEFMTDYTGKPVKVTIKNETSEYKEKTYENTNVKRWNKSDFPVVAHQWKDGTAPQQAAGTIDINESQLPF